MPQGRQKSDSTMIKRGTPGILMIVECRLLLGWSLPTSTLVWLVCTRGTCGVASINWPSWGLSFAFYQVVIVGIIRILLFRNFVTLRLWPDFFSVTDCSSQESADFWFNSHKNHIQKTQSIANTSLCHPFFSHHTTFSEPQHVCIHILLVGCPQ